MKSELKNKKNHSSAKSDVAQARRVTWIGFWVNAILAVAKIAGGIIACSSALVADGIHSFSDFASDIIVLTMVGMARKHPDERHQFGHGRYESFATILLSVVLAIVAINIFYDSICNIIAVAHGEILLKPGVLALIILLVSVISKEWLYQITRKVGERIHSETVIANAWHHRSDSWSSIATLFGVAGAIFLGESWRILDPIAAMIVGIFIIGISIRMARPALSELLGASLPQDDLHIINETLSEIPGVKGWHALRTFKSGNDAFIEVHLKLDPELKVLEAHKIATNAEHAIKRRLKNVIAHIITHIEPYSPKSHKH